MEDKITNIKERILQLAKYKGVAYEKFFEGIGMTYGNFKGKSKETPLNSNAIADILSIYPDTNLEWLLIGKGAPFKSSNVPISKDIEPSIPFYNDVMSIGGTAVATNNKAEGVEYINPGDWFPGATAAIRHYGESMQEYPSGCILVLKELKDLIHGFIFGQNYVLEYGEDWNRVTKRVQKNGKLLMAYSTNLDTYPDGTLIHQPFEILKIHRAWRIVGCIIKMESSNGIISVHK